MNRMLNKLRSGRGASITFALLLFLVCAVISSVVLAAATVAAGRIAQISQTDQRYYAVTSACELLKDNIDGKAVSVITDKNGDTTTKYVFDKAAYEVTDEDLVVGNKYTSGNKFSDIMQYAVYQYDINAATSSFPVAFTLSLQSAISRSDLGLDSTDPDPVGITINGELDSGGNMVLTVMNTTKKSSDPQFRQKLVFSGTVTKDNYTSLFRIDDDNRTVSGTTIKWTLTGVETV